MIVFFYFVLCLCIKIYLVWFFNWINVEGRCMYKNYWKEIDDVEMKKFNVLIILIGVCKFKNGNDVVK